MSRFCLLTIFIALALLSCKQKTHEKSESPLSHSAIVKQLITSDGGVSPAIDSLKSLLSNTFSDTQKIFLLNSMAEEWITINPEETKRLADEALYLSSELNFQQGVADALNCIGLYYYYIDLYDKSINSYRQSIRISRSLKSRMAFAKSQYGIGNIYRFTGESDSALVYFSHAINLYQNEIMLDSSSIAAQKGLSATYDKIGNIYASRGDYGKSLEYTQKSLEISQRIGDIRAMSYSMHTLAIGFYYQGEMSKALEYNKKSLQIRNRIGDKVGTASSLQNIGLIHSVKGDVKKALEYFHQSLIIKEEIGDRRGASYSYFHIGVIYKDQGDWEKALEYYQMGLAIREEIGDRNGVGYLLNQEGEVFIHLIQKLKHETNRSDSVQRLTEMARNRFAQSQQIFEQTNDQYGLANSLQSMGRLSLEQEDFTSASNQFEKSLKISETIGNKNGITETLHYLAQIHLLSKKPAKAIDLAKRSYSLAKELGSPEKIKDASFLLYEIYQKTRKPDLALEFFKESVAMRDSVKNIENKDVAEKMHWKFEYEKKAITDSLTHIQTLMVKNLELGKKVEETKRQRIALYALGFVFVSAVILAFAIYRGYRLKMAANRTISEKNQMLEQAFEEIKATSDTLSKQNETLKEQNEEITRQNNEIETQRNSLANLAWELQDKSEEVEKQRNILSSQNKEITDSIVYAQRIQSAVLPSDGFLRQLFTDHFIFYRPKSIVSGDFYWATLIKDLLVFCVTDCTGHGVPGAFMSMMGVSFLNEIVRKEEVTNAAQVLDELRNHVISSMEETEEDFVQFDGMDVGLCVLNTKTLLLQFAGSNIPCWIATPNPVVKEGDCNQEIISGLVELRPDRMPIGRYERMHPFKLIEYQLSLGDIIYLASDGFADQFGGSDEKKFQRIRLMELLFQISHLPLAQQSIILESTFDEWKGDRNQIDDVTILSIRV